MGWAAPPSVVKNSSVAKSKIGLSIGERSASGLDTARMMIGILISCGLVEIDPVWRRMFCDLALYSYETSPGTMVIKSRVSVNDRLSCWP